MIMRCPECQEEMEETEGEFHWCHNKNCTVA